MNKIVKKIFIMLSFVLLFFNMLYINALDDGKINIDKSATKVYDGVDSSNLEKGRKVQVSLDVTANEYTMKKIPKQDIIIVLDNSSSMDTKDANDEHTLSRRTAVKNAAKTFINALMAESSPNIRIGATTFGSDLISYQGLTSDKTEITNYINNIKSMSSQGTNLHAGLSKANELLNNDSNSDTKKMLIILTDGEPTFFNYEQNRYVNGVLKTDIKRGGTGNSDNSVTVCYYYNKSNICENQASIKPSTVAKGELDSIKEDHNNIDVYTIAFGNSVGNVLSDINPASDEGETPIYSNLQAENEEELLDNFETISNVVIDLIGKNSIVIDVIPKYFTLTHNSVNKLKNEGINIVNNDSGGVNLTWNIGNISANNEYKISYEIKALDDYYGSVYTNEEAFLNTVIDNTNPYYEIPDDLTITLNFERPTVEIPMVTKNDTYLSDPSYICYNDSLINGNSILTNDNNKFKHSDGNGVEITDKIVVKTDANVIKNLDNTYTIMKKDIKQGILDMNDDGTFTFEPNEDISGDVEFSYYVETTINPYHEINKVVSNTSKVTLNILKKIDDSSSDESNNHELYLSEHTDENINNSNDSNNLENVIAPNTGVDIFKRKKTWIFILIIGIVSVLYLYIKKYIVSK